MHQLQMLEYKSLLDAVCASRWIKSANALLVAIDLVRRYPDDMDPSVRAIAKACRMSPRSVHNAIVELEYYNVIGRADRTDRPGATNRYYFKAFNGSAVTVPMIGSEPTTAPPPRRRRSDPPSEGGGAHDVQTPPLHDVQTPPLHDVQTPSAPRAEHVLHHVQTPPAINHPSLSLDDDDRIPRASRPPSAPPIDLQAIVDLNRWALPDEWIREWTAKGFKLERLEWRWATYRGKFGGAPRSVAYIRKALLDWHDWEDRHVRRASVPPENAQRGAVAGVSSSAQEKDGGLVLDAPTRAAARELGVDIGRLATDFVATGEAARHGSKASEVFKRRLQDAVTRQREENAIPASEMQGMIDAELRKLRGAAA